MARDWIELQKYDGSVLAFSGEFIAEAESGARRPAGLFLAEYQFRAPPAPYGRYNLFLVFDAPSRYAGQIVTGDLTSKSDQSDASFLKDDFALLDSARTDWLTSCIAKRALMLHRSGG